jgi:multimeric flavodoxin WrbA
MKMNGLAFSLLPWGGNNKNPHKVYHSSLLITMTKALVLYHSQQSGNTAKMAEAVADGLKSEGLEVTLHNANEGRFPISDFSKYDCVAFGTPDYFGYLAGTIKTFMDDWYLNRNQPGNSGKPYALFYSHGGGGRVKESLNLFSRVGTIIGDPVGSRSAPSPEVLEECMQLGIKLAKAVK